MSKACEERYVEGADGVRLFVRDGGNRNGPPVLLIHGYLFSSEIFERQFAGELAETCRLIAMDVRGHGKSDKPKELGAYLDARSWADDVARVIASLGLETPSLVGWSMGSRVALNYGWVHGFEKVAAFNLTAAVVDGPVPGTHAPMPPHLQDLLSDDVDARLAATRTFIAACAAGAERDEQLEARWLEIAMAVPVVARRGARQWPVLYSQALAKLETPILVTHGRGDVLVPEAAPHELCTRLRNAELVLIGGGHLNFFQDPVHFNERLAGLVARVAGVKPCPN